MPIIVLLAGGDYPTHPTPLKVLQQATHLYCCDQAGLTAIQHGLHPTAIIGDGDSLTDEQKQQFGTLYHQVDEQEDNDLTKALRFALKDLSSPSPSGEDEVGLCILGATGKREDHTLGNIGLLMRYERDFGVHAVMLTDHGRFTPAQGRTRFESFPGQQVSIFNFGCTRLESDGLRWPAYACSELWQGTLNESTTDSFTLNGNGRYLVFQTWERK